MPRLDMILAAYISLCAVCIVLLQALSLVRAITLMPFLIGAMAVGCAVIFPVLDALRGIALRVQPPRGPLDAVALPFALGVPALAAILFACGWHAPPNNWDSMTYHLARAAFWRQWHSLAHYPTDTVRQNAFPGNAEVLILATLLLAGTAKLAFLVQWSAYVASAIALYGLGRKGGLRPGSALFGAGCFAAMPEVVLQATTEQNDLTAAAFLLCAAYFGNDVARTRRPASMVLAAAAIGLAVGTKPTAALALPGFLAVLIVWAIHTRATWAGRVSRWAIATGSAAALLAGILALPWYVANWRDYGRPSGNAYLDTLQRVAHPGVASFEHNLARHGIALLDPGGVSLVAPEMARTACSRAAQLQGWLAGSAHLPVQERGVLLPGTSYIARPPCVPGEDVSWFGPLGIVAIFASIAVLVRAVARHRVCPATLCAAGACSSILCASLLLRWQPWEGRLLVPTLALAAPALGHLSGMLYKALIGRLILAGLSIVAIDLGLATTTLDVSRPLRTWGVDAISAMALNRPEIAPVLRAIDRTVPASATMAIAVNEDEWQFPLFGPRLTRTIVPIDLHAIRASLRARPAYVFTHLPAADLTPLWHDGAFRTCRPLWQVRANGTGGEYRLYRCVDP